MHVVMGDENGATSPVRIVMQDIPLALELNKLDAESGAAVDGKVVVMQINPRTYRIEEITAAEGYALAGEVTATATDANTSAVPATVALEKYRLALRITKVDAHTRQTFTGAVFSLVNKQSEVSVNGRADTSEVTNKGGETFTLPQSGSLTVLGVPIAAYTLREVGASVREGKS